jgi:hypothetical protein
VKNKGVTKSSTIDFTKSQTLTAIKSQIAIHMTLYSAKKAAKSFNIYFSIKI